jgi:arylsulfatase A-like enzyme
MITRRAFLASAAEASLAPGASRPPNVVVFLADDLGSGDLGCQGATDSRTPHIDSIAADGARFINWYANAPMCAPSRAALMTGRYPIRCGVPVNGPALPPSELALPRLLKKQGYLTALMGKWHLGSDDASCPNGHGFDYFYGFHSGCIDFYSHRYYWGDPKTVNYHDLWRNRTEIFEDGQYFTELITREARNFISANRNHPFFLYIPYNAVHYPMHAPPKYVERFAALERERQMYCAMLSAMDDSVGEILDLLRKLNLYDNTMIFFGGDNGATTEARAGLAGKPATAGRNKPYRGYKFSLFDGGVHVSALLSWPCRIPKGKVITEVGTHLDLLPTIVNAAGGKLPPDRTIDGRDILPAAAGKAASPHEALFWSSGKQAAVRRGKWKLVENGFTADGSEDGRKPLAGDDALFLSDLEADPGESKNMRRMHPNLVDEMLTQLRQWQEEVKRP